MDSKYLEMLEELKAQALEEFEDWDAEDDSYKEEKGETLASVLAECYDSLICESVKHFLSDKCRLMEEEGRYFYHQGELDDFKERFTKKGGKLDDLHIGKVYDLGSFLCYEVCRKKYYNTTQTGEYRLTKPVFFS